MRALACLLATLVVLAPWASVEAQDPTAVFDAAVAHYQRGHFDSAAAGFTRIVQSGIDDPRVWYNLGNSQFKSGHIGASLVAYRRGMRLAPRDADLVANYRYARLFAADKIEPVGELFISKWWRALVDRISFREATWLAALAFWIAAGATAWRFWPNVSRRASYPLWVVIAGWAVWLTLTGASATCFARDIATKDGFVIAAQTDVRGGPGNEYTLQFVAHDGLAGTVERTESGWHLIRFPNGLKGWLQANAFEIL